MKNANGKLEELYLDGSARITCPPEVTPAPGQYLLAHTPGSDSPLPVTLFSSLIHPKSGFRSAPGIPSYWKPGDILHLRGPIGHGYSMPVSARKVALIAFDDTPARLQGLIAPAITQNAEVVVVCGLQAVDLPEAVEIQPLDGLFDVLQWADYAAVDVSRENLQPLRERLAGLGQAWMKIEAQVLVRAPMPCGGLADCGVCALSRDQDWREICKDGPVFPLRDCL